MPVPIIPCITAIIPTDWFAYNEGLPFYANTDIAKPFYRDGKIRLATYGKGIWQSDLYELPAHPVAQPMVDKLSVYCEADTFYFEDHSILVHEGASWSWSSEGGARQHHRSGTRRLLSAERVPTK